MIPVSTPGSRHRRYLIQGVGIIACIALLAWCIHMALRPENRAKLETLRDAPPAQIALLLALSFVTLFVNGVCFWLTMRPVRRLPFWDMQAANAVASFLAYLPFKLSVVWRFIVHNRRDKVPILTIGAWLTANAVIVLACLAPLAAVGLWRKNNADALFAVAALIGLTLSYGAVLGGARLFAGERGFLLLQRLASPFPLLPRLLQKPAARNLHAGFDMLSHPATLALAMAARVLDVLLQAARFVVAADAMGDTIPWGSAVILASSFYLIGVASPSGAVGAREGGTTGLGALLAIPGAPAETVAVAALVVSASEMVVFFACALAGAVWLRPDRMWRGTDTHVSPPASRLPVADAERLEHTGEGRVDR